MSIAKAGALRPTIILMNRTAGRTCPTEAAVEEYAGPTETRGLSRPRPARGLPRWSRMVVGATAMVLALSACAPPGTPHPTEAMTGKPAATVMAPAVLANGSQANAGAVAESVVCVLLGAISDSPCR